MDWLWNYALGKMLGTLMQHGNLRIETPDGRVRTYGDATGRPLTVRLHDAATVRHLVLDPDLALGESYMNGTLTIDDDDLQSFLGLILRNLRDRLAGRIWWQKPRLWLRASIRGLLQNNVVARSRHNVAHHYDLSGKLYGLFLDGDRQYSCAYFKDPNATLEQAQADKKAHIARKLRITPGMRVLDIGCGWGGMALTLARDYGAHVVGITLSEEQFAYARERVKKAGLADQVDIRLCDYRDIDETFDRIVSVGMFEHVGLPYFDKYFQKVRDLLKPDGIALVHTIGWNARSEGTNPWIAKYIFPGGYIPTISEATEAIENSELWVADIESLRLHYAYTLRHWYDRFNEHQAEVRALYDERFVRMWRFYLAACEQTFRHNRQAVFQFQLSRKVDAVPLTRDYLYQPAEAIPASQAAE